jgi:membrane protease YdiL (CAAX protease family)
MQRSTAAVLSVIALSAVSCAVAEPASPTSEFDILALQGLWLEGCLALIALTGASLLPGSAYARLGLSRGRLNAAQVSVFVIGTLAASASLDGLLELTQWKAESALGEFEAMLTGIRGRSLLFAIAAFAVMPGIAEELLCRGLIQRGLVARLGPVAGISIASLIFGALHLDPVHALFAAPLGLYLGLVCWLSGSIRASIVCHIANNLTALLAGAMLPASETQAVPAVVVGAIIATASMVWVWRTAGPPPRRPAPAPDSAVTEPAPENPR